MDSHNLIIEHIFSCSECFLGLSFSSLFNFSHASIIFSWLHHLGNSLFLFHSDEFLAKHIHCLWNHLTLDALNGCILIFSSCYIYWLSSRDSALPLWFRHTLSMQSLHISRLCLSLGFAPIPFEISTFSLVLRSSSEKWRSICSSVQFSSTWFLQFSMNFSPRHHVPFLWEHFGVDTISHFIPSLFQVLSCSTLAFLVLPLISDGEWMMLHQKLVAMRFQTTVFLY